MGLLSSRSDLGIHSGLFSDGLIDPLESGAITGARKGADIGVVVVTEAIGTADLYRWLDYNSRVLFAPASYTHSPIVLSQQHRLVAINSAIEVALDGTVNAETVSGRRVSGPGGQPDFTASALIHGGLECHRLAIDGRARSCVPNRQGVAAERGCDDAAIFRRHRRHRAWRSSSPGPHA